MFYGFENTWLCKKKSNIFLSRFLLSLAQPRISSRSTVTVPAQAVANVRIISGTKADKTVSNLVLNYE
jgi:hypothetical protein